MARTGLRSCNGFYEARSGKRKSAEYSIEESKLRSCDNILLIQNVSRSVNADKDYVKFLKLSYNYDKSSLSYTNELGNDGSYDKVEVEVEEEDEDEPHYKMFLANGKGDGSYDKVEVEEEDEDDPHYKMFLANAKGAGRSYMLNVDTKDEFPLSVNYEKECECNYGCKCLCQEKQKDIDMRKDAVDEEKLLNKCSKDELKNWRFPTTDLGCDSNRSMGGMDVVFESSNPTYQRNSGIMSRKLSTGKHGASKRQGKCETKIKSGEEKMMVKGSKPVRVTSKRKASDVDGNYVVVLEDLQCKNWAMKARNIVYEAIEDDVEILYDSSDMLKKISKQSEFRQKVMDLLKKPYSPMEYQELWTFVNERKPVEKHRESRAGVVRPCKTDKIGKSYLEYYTDLEEKLLQVDNDERKKLKILRSFSFWLQNLTNKGAFKPWNDTEFLARVAESS